MAFNSSEAHRGGRIDDQEVVVLKAAQAIEEAPRPIGRRPGEARKLGQRLVARQQIETGDPAGSQHAGERDIRVHQQIEDRRAEPTHIQPEGLGGVPLRIEVAEQDTLLLPRGQARRRGSRRGWSYPCRPSH